MTSSEVQSIVKDAKDTMKRSFFVNRSLSDALKTEIQNFEKKVKDVMGKSVKKLDTNDEIPESIENAADYLRSCHTMGCCICPELIRPVSGLF